MSSGREKRWNGVLSPKEKRQFLSGEDELGLHHTLGKRGNYEREEDRSVHRQQPRVVAKSRRDGLSRTCQREKERE